MIVTITNVCELCGHRHHYQGRVYGDWEGDDHFIGPDECDVCKGINEMAPKVYQLAILAFEKYKKQQAETNQWKAKYFDLRSKAGLL